MKGLLLKDLYMINRYFRMFLGVALLFIVLSAVLDSLFYAFYPVVFLSMIPISLLSYDERCHWQQFADAAPYTRRDVVKGKYQLLFLCLAVILILELAAQSIQMVGTHSFDAGKLLDLIGWIAVCGLVLPAISLPLSMKLGPERGRVAQLFFIGAICAVAYIAVSANHVSLTMAAGASVLPFALVGCLVLVHLSYRLSVRFYERREF